MNLIVSSAMRKERCVTDVARRQNWLITTGQLQACGLSPASISRRVTLQRLCRVHRGVYLVGRAELSAVASFQAAVLAVGDGAVLSHRAAAALWGFWHGEVEPIEVTVPRRLRQRPGIRIHCVDELPRA